MGLKLKSTGSLFFRLDKCPMFKRDPLFKAGFGDYLENLLNCVEANQQVLEEVKENWLHLTF